MLEQGRKEGSTEEGVEPRTSEGLRAAGPPLKLWGLPLPNTHPAWSAAATLPSPSVFPSAEWLPAGQDPKAPCQL